MSLMNSIQSCKWKIDSELEMESTCREESLDEKSTKTNPQRTQDQLTLSGTFASLIRKSWVAEQRFSEMEQNGKSKKKRLNSWSLAWSTWLLGELGWANNNKKSRIPLCSILDEINWAKDAARRSRILHYEAAAGIPCLGEYGSTPPLTFAMQKSRPFGKWKTFSGKLDEKANHFSGQGCRCWCCCWASQFWRSLRKIPSPGAGLADRAGLGGHADH